MVLLACRQLDVDPQTALFIGDDLRDIEAAQAAGMRSIAAAWGYISPGTPIEHWGADLIAATVAELVALLS